MKHVFALIVVLALATPLAAMSQASGPKKDPPAKAASKEQVHRAEDIARHRQMSRAHDEAARCLETGTPEKQCHVQLREACKGIAVGQYCGMRHAH